MGDSQEDLDVAAVVGRFFLVANALVSGAPGYTNVEGDRGGDGRRLLRGRDPNPRGVALRRGAADAGRVPLRGGGRALPDDPRGGGNSSTLITIEGHRGYRTRECGALRRRTGKHGRSVGSARCFPLGARVRSMDTFAEQVVDAINDISGQAPGPPRRARQGGPHAWHLHLPAGAGLTRALHMQSDPVEATRASPPGWRQRPDYAARHVRMAVKFYLSDGCELDIGAQPAVLLRAHAGGLPRVHPRPQARSGDRPARPGEGRRLPVGPPRGRPGDPGRAFDDPPESYATCAYN